MIGRAGRPRKTVDWALAPTTRHHRCSAHRRTGDKPSSRVQLDKRITNVAHELLVFGRDLTLWKFPQKYAGLILPALP
jgi:hypothetical protein